MFLNQNKNIFSFLSRFVFLKILREYHPLEQGLRLNNVLSLISKLPIREYHPLEQGLRLASDLIKYLFFCVIREYHPLEQGLRLVKRISPPLKVKIREYHPLEQGLRRFINLSVPGFPKHQRVSSIRTRIKTSTSDFFKKFNLISESIIH